MEFFNPAILLIIIITGPLAVACIPFSFIWLVLLFMFMYYEPRIEKPIDLTGAEIKNVKLDSDPVMYRELLDEQYLDRFAVKHPYIYAFWLLTSNCGRWIWLVLAWSVVIGLLFGFVYSHVPVSYTSVTVDQIRWWHPYYFSFVTMTTLGVATIEPMGGLASLVHTVQNVFGYIWLGYLIAVLGSKLTRRSA